MRPRQSDARNRPPKKITCPKLPTSQVPGLANHVIPSAEVRMCSPAVAIHRPLPWTTNPMASPTPETRETQVTASVEEKIVPPLPTAT